MVGTFPFFTKSKSSFLTIVFFSLLTKLLPFNLGSFSDPSVSLKFILISFATNSFLIKSRYDRSTKNEFLYLSSATKLFNLTTLSLIEYSKPSTL